ncbi:MAG TPA: 4'-phosphopantetheinyl transferase superfamily protein [Pricia sp.]|nr:4'-phosphopantetheinyl transferase superfamily protein [Pricia sp.]
MNTFELPTNEVQLWHCRFNPQREHLDTFLSLLSDDEKKRADTFKFKIDRQRSIMARGVLRSLLGSYLHRHPRDLQFGYTEYGKPFLRHEPSLRFNLSHSQDRAVFAFVRHADIGVDIEKINSEFRVMDIARNFFSSDEILALEALPEKERHEGFYRCWTRKESFIKAKGSGLSFSLRSFSVSLHVDCPELLHTAWHPSEKKEWQMVSFRPSEAYLVALSVRGNIHSVVQRDWKATDSLI